MRAESNLLRRIKFGVSQLPGSVTTSSHMLLREGQLILHRMSRMVGKSMSWGLSTLFRLTHPLLYNSTRFKENDIVLSGGLVMAATLSSSNSVCLLYFLLRKMFDIFRLFVFGDAVQALFCICLPLRTCLRC